MNHQNQKLSLHEDHFQAHVARRQRLSLILSVIVVAGYSALILLMAFAPDRLAAPMGSWGAVNAGLFWSFLYSLLTVLIMGVYVWARTVAGSLDGDGNAEPGADH